MENPLKSNDFKRNMAIVVSAGTIGLGAALINAERPHQTSSEPPIVKHEKQPSNPAHFMAEAGVRVITENLQEMYDYQFVGVSKDVAYTGNEYVERMQLVISATDPNTNKITYSQLVEDFIPGESQPRRIVRVLGSPDDHYIEGGKSLDKTEIVKYEKGYYVVLTSGESETSEITTLIVRKNGSAVISGGVPQEVANDSMEITVGRVMHEVYSFAEYARDINNRFSPKST